jgi:hypothetical protein
MFQKLMLINYLFWLKIDEAFNEAFKDYQSQVTRLYTED